jgi:hypothetical protein
MFLKFQPENAPEVDLTDHVDVVPSLVFRRNDSSVGGGIHHPSAMLGGAFTEAFEVSAEGVLFATSYSDLRSRVARILQGRKGYLLMENDRRTPAQLVECRIEDWQHGLNLAQLRLHFLCAGYAESVSETVATQVSNGWQVDNTGDLPAPVYIEGTFASTQSGQKVLFLGGVSPDGRTQRLLEFQGDVQAGDGLDFDAGVYGLNFQFNGDYRPDLLRAGFPFFARVGTSVISFSFVPSNSFSSRSLLFRRRWLML